MGSSNRCLEAKLPPRRRLHVDIKEEGPSILNSKGPSIFFVGKWRESRGNGSPSPNKLCSKIFSYEMSVCEYSPWILKREAINKYLGLSWFSKGLLLSWGHWQTCLHAFMGSRLNRAWVHFQNLYKNFGSTSKSYIRILGFRFTTKNENPWSVITEGEKKEIGVVRKWKSESHSKQTSRSRRNVTWAALMKSSNNCGVLQKKDLSERANQPRVHIATSS